MSVSFLFDASTHLAAAGGGSKVCSPFRLHCYILYLALCSPWDKMKYEISLQPVSSSDLLFVVTGAILIILKFPVYTDQSSSSDLLVVTSVRRPPLAEDSHVEINHRRETSSSATA